MSQRLEQQVQNLLAFAGASKAASNAVFIAVMGVTGAGKSTFVSQCTGRDVDVGHGLLSCKFPENPANELTILMVRFSQAHQKSLSLTGRWTAAPCT